MIVIPVGTTGATGAAGAAGSVIRHGTGVPSNGLGANGDYYINTTNFDLYVKSTGAYSLLGNIKGADGTDGVDGSTWRSGSGTPSNGLGVNGDFYLRTSNGNVYYKSAGVYSITANIKGATGNPGINGALVYTLDNTNNPTPGAGVITIYTGSSTYVINPVDALADDLTNYFNSLPALGVGGTLIVATDTTGFALRFATCSMGTGRLTLSGVSYGGNLPTNGSTVYVMILMDGTAGTNGVDGADGADGTNGANGTNGTNGADGPNNISGTTTTSLVDGVIRAFSGVIVNDTNGSGVIYLPSTTSDWNSTPPADMLNALDRCAALLKILNSGIGP